MDARRRNILKDQSGFTLVEIIAVLIILGILAAVAIPKYMDMADSARQKAAQGQIAEVKGRLSTALASYMLNNAGNKPADGSALVTAANTPNTLCPASSTVEGDFTYSCSGTSGARTVGISVTAVQGTTVTTVAGTYDFTN